MIARWPGRIRSGAVNGLPWSFCDFLPTAAELAGAKAPTGIDGISVAPTLLGSGKQARHEFLYWELPRYDGKTGTFPKETPMQALRMGGWKAVRPKPDGELELYNLQQDIGETTDVAARNPEILGRIEKHLAAARTGPRPQSQPPAEWTLR